MEQVLKISIARGGCRFATPLYLGAKYVLTFDGERADEAKSVLFVKPRSDDASKSDTMSALAQSEYDSTVSGISLNLNKQVLLDWFEDCGACDVDGCVDAHCYVFDADGAILADADVAIEWKPIQFAADETAIQEWSDLDDRLVAVEEKTAEHSSSIADLQYKADALAAADKANLQEAKDYAKESDDVNLALIRGEIGELKGSTTSVQMVHEEGAATTGKTYHKITAVQQDGVWTLGVKQEAEEFSATDLGAFAMLEANQNFTGLNTFTGSNKGISVSGGAKVDVASTGSVKVSGGATFTGATTFTGTTTFTGATTFTRDTKFTGTTTFTGATTFTGTTEVPTASAEATGTVAASVGWVREVFSTLFDAVWSTAKAAFLSAANTWSGKQTFTGDAALKSSAVEAGTVPATTLYGPHLSLQDKNGMAVGLLHGTFEDSDDGGNYGVSLEAQSKANGLKAGVFAGFDADENSVVRLVGNSVEVPDPTTTASDFLDVKGDMAMCFSAFMRLMPYLRVRKNVSPTTTPTWQAFSGGFIPNATYSVKFIGLTKSTSYVLFYARRSTGVFKTFTLASPSAVAYSVRTVSEATDGTKIEVASDASGEIDMYIYVANANIVIGCVEFELTKLPNVS